MNRKLRTTVEASVLLLLAGGVGLIYNAQRAQGLNIARNYFPKLDIETPGKTTLPEEMKTTPSASEAAASSSQLKNELPPHGYNVVNLEEAYSYFLSDQPYGVFIDARNDQPYSEGHIPGAIQFNYYHPEEHTTDVLEHALVADQIIIYCNGGDCEDSLLAARYLTIELDPPLDFARVSVFEGGIQEWKDAGYPITTGNQP